jgi:hypothetical protein
MVAEDYRCRIGLLPTAFASSKRTEATASSVIADNLVKDRLNVIESAKVLIDNFAVTPARLSIHQGCSVVCCGHGTYARRLLFANAAIVASRVGS